MKNNYRYSEDDYEFMNSLNSAILQRTPKKIRLVLWFWIITVSILIAWSYYSEIDEIIRGEGKVVPVDENKIVQNLEGGIIEKIFVKEGSLVKKGDILIRIDNQNSLSDYNTSNLKILELKAKLKRLEAEINDKKFEIDTNAIEELKKHEELEYKLYKINKNKLNYEIDVLKEQLFQKNNDLSSIKSSISYLRNEYNLSIKEIKILKPLVAKKLKAKSELLKLQRESNNIRKQLAEARLSIPKIKSLIQESKSKIVEIKENFRKTAQEEFNKTSSELERVSANINNLKDKVVRTDVHSPSDGIIQKLFINTIGGVIKPGENLVEIVPTKENLLIETKIKPADIAFIHYKQKVQVKFTAYDYSIYGGLEGNVIKISPDTEIDENKKSFYTVHVQTDENYLKKGDKELPIIPGMIANVDILTGKKTVFDYIMKPILKAKQYTFTER